ncbi:hypothetical protein [Mycobacterium kubicae]|uniref:hypothetical protein n=1 Tax=Mycobacterium kubicae TaxID=120959 RepID=UPI000829ADCF|nr:hypothetical protein [Mycobacterium kubicae]
MSELSQYPGGLNQSGDQGSSPGAAGERTVALPDACGTQQEGIIRYRDEQRTLEPESDTPPIDVKVVGDCVDQGCDLDAVLPFDLYVSMLGIETSPAEVARPD